MYKHILIPTDGSELSKKAVDQGIGLAKALNAKVTAVTVSEPFHVFAVEPGMVTDTPDEYKKRIAAVAAKYLEAAKNAATTAGVPCDVVQVEHEHPYETIIDTARKRGCDAIVMASHGRRGVSAVVLGSETVKVLTHSNIPVVVVRA
ncbi:MAG TPA: universal stress protein [Pseudolabrys sp.]|nr:universal stress protein [Pseudolabrys sp.]